MNSRELPFREIDGSSFLMLPEGAAGMGDPSGAGDVVPRDEGSRLCDVLPVNRTMKKYKICVTIILNFLLVIF